MRGSKSFRYNHMKNEQENHNVKFDRLLAPINLNAAKNRNTEMLQYNSQNFSQNDQDSEQSFLKKPNYQTRNDKFSATQQTSQINPRV